MIERQSSISQLAPRLRSGVKVIRIGESNLLILGGRRVLHISGPAAPSATLALITLLDGRTAPEDAIRSFGPEVQESVWRSYHALGECGLLTVAKPRTASTLWDLFIARYADENVGPVALPLPSLPTGSPTTDAILCHARLAAAAGLPVSGAIETDMFVRVRGRQKAEMIRGWHPVTSSLSLNAGIESRILWPIVGCENRDGVSRWICPSAGDLRSMSVIVLRRSEGLAVLETFEHESGARILIRSLGYDVLPDELEPARGSICFLVSCLERLSVRYGPLARDLAASDAGMAAALLARSAAAEGWSAEWIEFPDDSALRDLLGLADDRDVIAIPAVVRIAPRSHAKESGDGSRPSRLTNRTSCRQFSSRTVTGVERFESLARHDHARLHFGSGVTLIRTSRQIGADFRLSYVASDRRARFATAEDMALIITQPNLRLAPLIFFCVIGEGDGQVSELPSGAALLGFLWLRAVEHGLVGTLCAAVDTSAATNVVGQAILPLALCLGFPGPE